MAVSNEGLRPLNTFTDVEHTRQVTSQIPKAFDQPPSLGGKAPETPLQSDVKAKFLFGILQQSETERREKPSSDQRFLQNVFYFAGNSDDPKIKAQNKQAYQLTFGGSAGTSFKKFQGADETNRQQMVIKALITDTNAFKALSPDEQKELVRMAYTAFDGKIPSDIKNRIDKNVLLTVSYEGVKKMGVEFQKGAITNKYSVALASFATLPKLVKELQSQFISSVKGKEQGSTLSDAQKIALGQLCVKYSSKKEKYYFDGDTAKKLLAGTAFEGTIDSLRKDPKVAEGANLTATVQMAADAAKRESRKEASFIAKGLIVVGAIILSPFLLIYGVAKSL